MFKNLPTTALGLVLIAGTAQAQTVTGCGTETSNLKASKVYYVTPTGSATGAGTSFSAPMSFSAALAKVAAGEMVLLQPGTYTVPYVAGAKNTITLSKSGSSSAKIYLVAANCGRAVFDFSFPDKTYVQDSFGFYLTGSHWYLKGIAVTRAGYQGTYVTGSRNTFEHCAFYNNRNTGLEINKGGSYTTVINSDAYRNYDPKKNGGMADGSGTIAPTGQWLAYELGQRDRRAISTSLQWRPNAQSEYTLDWNLSKLDNQTEVYGHYASPFWANFDNAKNQGQLWPNGAVTKDGAGRFVKGEFWGASMSTSGSVADETTQVNQLALAGKWKLGSGTTLKSELSHTSSEFERFYQEVRLGSFADSPTFAFDLSTELPSAYSPQAQLSNPANYWADKVLYFKIQNHGKETAWKLAAEHGIGSGFFSRMRGGLRIADRQADSTEINTINDIWMFALSTVPNVGLLPQDDLLRRAGDGRIARQWLTVTNADWLRDANAVRSTFNLSVPGFDPAQTFDFQERSAAVYGAVDFDSSLAGRPLTGNLGLRAVQTSTKRSYANLSGGREQANGDETDWLPALNLRWELQRSLIARLALSKVVTRPNFDQLTPSLSKNVNDRTAYRGNPALGQLSANQIDTTLEYYPSSSDHVYAAAFHKAVKGFIQHTSSPVPFKENNIDVNYTVTTPNNGPDGRINGLEVGYQGFFKTLPGWMSGLGLQANATFVNSRAPSLIDGRMGPLEGLSKQSANLMALYDLGSFSARLAYNWRSDYLVGTRLSYPTNDGKTAMTPVTMKSYGMVDAYFSYSFKPGLKLALEGNNLTRTVRQTQFSDYGLPRGTYVDDRRVALSLHAEL